MDELEQAQAYANADFEEPHSRVIELYDAEFPGSEIRGSILDLGCGPGDVTLRFARRFPEATITAVDGSAAMIRLANERRARERELADRVEFIEGCIPGAPIPRICYDLIISTSFLHHLHQPAVLWQTIAEYSADGTRIFVVDLSRPENRAEAEELVNRYAADEPVILQRDFYNSLLAAFRPKEIEEQLVSVGLGELSIKRVSDRHLMVAGEKR
jgi:SAM-dependent methyltransferase